MTVTPRILLIDDEPNIRESIGAYLEDNDYEILEAASGREGVDLFLEKNPDCVLVDLRMPGMGGLEVLAELTEKSPETPILVVSRTGVIQDAVGALRLGAWDFVTKPIVDMDILGHAVAKAMERAELLRENRLHKEFLEREVERRTQELTLANERLREEMVQRERAEKAKSVFLANMSHELRTPLNGVIGMTNLLLAGDPTPKQKKFLELSLEASMQLLSVVSDILELSNIDSDRFELVSETFSPAEILSPLFTACASMAEKKGLTFSSFIDPDAPETLFGDGARLRQVIMNLAQNALKFTEQGGIAIDIRPARKATSQEPASETDNEIEMLFSVRDTGIGIQEDMQEEIFESFSIGEDFLKKQYGEAGLGLSISKKLVEMMGGKIWVDSAPGQGSVFQFTAKFMRRPASSLDEIENAVFIPNPTERKPRTIFYAETEPIHQTLVGRTLKDNGFEAVIFEALPRFAELLAQSPCDLLLLDIRPPGFDALELIRSIREDNASVPSDLPIIALSAHPTSLEKRHALEAGATVYLAKPVHGDDLMIAIKEALAG